MRKIQSQAVHHIALVGAGRQTSIGFWEGVVALSVSQATFAQVVERLDERGISRSGVKDRGSMDSIYFNDPLGLLIELASCRFEPPAGHSPADVLLEAHRLRVARGDHNNQGAVFPDADRG